MPEDGWQRQMERKPFLGGGIALFVCWLLLHLFSITWELPHTMPPEPDGISPRTSLGARSMMAAETYKYPPLQYLIVDALTPDIDEKDMNQEQILENRSRRLAQMRWITASMEYLTALLILLFSLEILKLSLLPAFGGALAFLLFPPVLYYSQTTNMDIPYTFWFFASVASAAFAERFHADKRKYILLSLLTGLLIACAFCSKDQIYASYLLPAAGFALWRFLRYRKWSAVLLPFLLWLAAFLTGCTLIYLAIGFDAFLPHVRWIVGEGSAPYAEVGNTLAGRLRLLPIQLADLGTVLDFPFLLFLLFSVVFLLSQKKRLAEDRSLLLLTAALILFLLSYHLFFCQVVRYTYPRFLLPVLPFFALLAAYLGQKGMDKRILRWMFLLFLLFQALVAVQFLYLMTHTPRARLIAELEESGIHTQVRMNTASARVGNRYWLKNSIQHPRKCIRSWGDQLGLNRFGVYDIMPDDISIYMASPALVVSESPSPELEHLGFRLKQSYGKVPLFLPTLYTQDVNTLYLYAAEAPPESGDPLAAFRKENLETQIIKLAYLVGKKPPLTNTKLAEIGRALAPFREPDSENYELPYHAFVFLHFAYRAADRKEDAARLRSYLARMFPDLPPPA